MAEKRIQCAFGVDLDAVGGWLGSYGGEDSPDDISRGMFAGEVGTPRLVRMFDRLGVKTTWFIPGHSADTFPEECKMIVDAGHEIGLHGYSHENPISMSPEQEEAVLLRCIEVLSELAGKPPTGYVAPWWEFSHVTNELLLKHGIKYDHSLMHKDFECYYVRVGDRWTKIDYSQPADVWMHALVRGEDTDLVEIPANWYLDDLPPMMFIKKSPNSPRVCKPQGHRVNVEGPVRLRVQGIRRGYLPHYHPPRRQRTATGNPYARAAHRLHPLARRRAVRYFQRDSRRLSGPEPPQQIAACVEHLSTRGRLSAPSCRSRSPWRGRYCLNDEAERRSPLVPA